MAKVIWNKQAETEWRKRLLYGLDEFGETTAISFVQRTNYIVDIIRKHPKAGIREPTNCWSRKRPTGSTTMRWPASSN